MPFTKKKKKKDTDSNLAGTRLAQRSGLGLIKFILKGITKMCRAWKKKQIHKTQMNTIDDKQVDLLCKVTAICLYFKDVSFTNLHAEEGQKKDGCMDI